MGLTLLREAFERLLLHTLSRHTKSSLLVMEWARKTLFCSPIAGGTPVTRKFPNTSLYLFRCQLLFHLLLLFSYNKRRKRGGEKGKRGYLAAISLVRVRLTAQTFAISSPFSDLFSRSLRRPLKKGRVLSTIAGPFAVIV